MNHSDNLDCLRLDAIVKNIIADRQTAAIALEFRTNTPDSGKFRQYIKFIADVINDFVCDGNTLHTMIHPNFVDVGLCGTRDNNLFHGVLLPCSRSFPAALTCSAISLPER